LYLYEQLMKLWRCLYPLVIYTVIQQIVFIAAGSSGISEQDAVALTTLAGAAAIPVLFVFYIRDRRTHQVLLYGRRAALRAYGLIIPLAVAASIALSFMTSFFSLSEKVESFHEVNRLLFSGSVPVQLAGIGVIVPVAEELVFRGLIQQRIRTYTENSYKAIGITALMFGLFHENIVQSAAAAAAGLLIGFLYEKYKHLAAPVLFHICFNLTGIAMQSAHIHVSQRSVLLPAAAGCFTLAAVVILAVCRVIPEPLYRKTSNKHV